MTSDFTTNSPIKAWTKMLELRPMNEKENGQTWDKEVPSHPNFPSKTPQNLVANPKGEGDVELRCNHALDVEDTLTDDVIPLNS